MNGMQFALMMKTLESIEAASKEAVEILKRIDAERLPAIEASVDTKQPSLGLSDCSQHLRMNGLPYPRTCKRCGLGKCVSYTDVEMLARQLRQG